MMFSIFIALSFILTIAPVLPAAHAAPPALETETFAIVRPYCMRKWGGGWNCSEGEFNLYVNAIQGLDGGVLKRKPEQVRVEVEQIEGIRRGQTVLFFENGEYVVSPVMGVYEGGFIRLVTESKNSFGGLRYPIRLPHQVVRTDAKLTEEFQQYKVCLIADGSRAEVLNVFRNGLVQIETGRFPIIGGSIRLVKAHDLKHCGRSI